MPVLMSRCTLFALSGTPSWWICRLIRFTAPPNSQVKYYNRSTTATGSTRDIYTFKVILTVIWLKHTHYFLCDSAIGHRLYYKLIYIIYIHCSCKFTQLVYSSLLRTWLLHIYLRLQIFAWLFIVVMKHNLTVSQPDYYINISELDQVKHFSIVPLVFVVGGFLFVCFWFCCCYYYTRCAIWFQCMCHCCSFYNERRFEFYLLLFYLFICLPVWW